MQLKYLKSNNVPDDSLSFVDYHDVLLTEPDLTGWKSLPGYSGYLISNRGQIWSLKKNRMIKSHKFGNYLTSALYADNGIRLTMHVHTLVASLYVENPDPNVYTWVNHLSGIKTDNEWENLEWTTPQENVAHAQKLGRRKDNGEDSNKAKLSNAEALFIYNSNAPATFLASYYKVTASTIRKIRRGITWSSITQPLKQAA